jgi:hypothetical protein
MTSRDTTSQIEHRIGATGTLSVKVADWDIQLAATDGDTVRISETDGRPLPDDLAIERGTDSLSISQPSRFLAGMMLGSRGGHRRLTIDVPTHAAVGVQTASGDIAATGLRGEQHLRTASGELHIDGAGGDLTTETVSGDIVVRVDGSVGLTVKTVSGEVLIEEGRVERISLTTTSGDVRLTSELGAGPHAITTVSGDAVLLSGTGIRITARTVAGDLQSDLPHTSEGGAGRRSLVVGDGATELLFKSVSGDLRVLDPATARNGHPSIPTPPLPPLPPLPPAETERDDAGTDEAARLEILRALENGEIDVAEATDRLASLDGATDD